MALKKTVSKHLNRRFCLKSNNFQNFKRNKAAQFSGREM